MISNKKVLIDDSWFTVLKDQFDLPYFKNLRDFVKQEYLNKKVFPASKNIFRAFNICPFDKVKVVIVGQDPYHGSGQADGLSFSVPSAFKVPPSLKNIFKEIEDDLSIKVKEDGDLSRWANQGVLLLNSSLTVVENSPASHSGLGWEIFTDSVIKKLSEEKSGLVFMLWGNFAKSKAGLIDESKHLVLKSAHPSPFSAHLFFKCKHFSLANKYFKKNSISEIDWS